MTEQPNKPSRPLPQSRIMVNAQTQDIYHKAWEAKQKGIPVGWSTAIFPQELCETFDIPVLYPENNAAAVSAKHLGDSFIEEAEKFLGYPINICSYARLNLGMTNRLKRDGTPIFEPIMPLPDFLLLSNNSCTQLMKWYENLSRALNIPIFFVDCLYNYSEQKPSQARIDYVRGQILETIEHMEDFFHRQFDWEHFWEIQKISQRNRQLFNEIVNMNSAIPSPLSGFDLFNYMSCLVLARGKRSTTSIFEQLKDEVATHMQNNTSTFPGEEKYRIHWEGIACWPNLGYILKTLKRYGINAVMNGYVTAWDVAYTPGNIDELALAYQASSTNSFSTKSIMEKRSASIKKFNCEGMLCHVNRSCKLMTFHIFVGRELIEEKNHIPVANFDGDQSDTRVFNEAHFETRVQSLVEIMETNKDTKSDEKN